MSINMYTGFTRLCKGLAVVLVGGHIVVQILPSAVSYLALIPAKTIPFAWNLITAGYTEQTVYRVCFFGVNYFFFDNRGVRDSFTHTSTNSTGYLPPPTNNRYKAIISTIGLLYLGKLLEPIWGSREFLKFIFIVNFLTSVFVFVTAISLYYITRLEIYLYMPISGFQGVLSGFLVGVKQIMPDQELSFLKLKAKWLPSLALLFSIAISFFKADSVSYLPTIVFGTYLGWIYLRYWQKKPETKLKGDPSDEFSLSSFFPEFLRPVIDPIATVFERMLCGRRSETPNEERGYTLGGSTLPGSDPIEASRRRERGARALEERLAAERLAAGKKAEESERDANDNV